MMNACGGQQFLHYIITKLRKKSLKTCFKKLNIKIKFFHYNKETGKILNKIMSQLLLTRYLPHKIVTKQRLYMNQNITITEKIMRFC